MSTEIRETINEVGAVSGPFAPSGDGRRALRVDWPSVSVLVQGTIDGPSVPSDEATEISRYPAVVSDLRSQVSALNEMVASLKAKIPPKEPAKMLGVGCVRMQDGYIYLLNNAEEGWSAFGIRFDSWDVLFREYGVIVEDPRTDKHGQYWPTTPT